MTTRQRIDRLFEGWSDWTAPTYSDDIRPSAQPNADPSVLHGLSPSEIKAFDVLQASPDQIAAYRRLKKKTKVISEPYTKGDWRFRTILVDVISSGGEDTVAIDTEGFLDHVAT